MLQVRDSHYFLFRFPKFKVLEYGDILDSNTQGIAPNTRWIAPNTQGIAPNIQGIAPNAWG